MQKYNILVVGETTWDASPSFLLYCEKKYSKLNIKYSQNVGLFYLNKDFLWINIDGIIWRGQFESESETQKYILEIIKLSAVPCINHPSVTINYSANLSMYYALCNAKMPVFKKQVLSFGKSSLDFIEPTFPCVLKIGNYHMGYGKALVRDNESWRDFIDMAVLLNEPVTIEPFVNYKIDIRCLYIGGQIKCIERKPSHWKANVCPVEIVTHTPPSKILEMTSAFAMSINADIIGMDWILDENDNWHILECNTGSGLIDFEEDCSALNKILLERIIKRK